MEDLLAFGNKGEIMVSPHILSIPEFSVLYKRDKSTGKLQVIKELNFIYNSESFRSNYAGLSDEDRQAQAKKDAGLPQEWRPDTAIISAIVKYQERNDTDMILLLKSAKIGLHKMRKHFEDIDLDERDENGKKVNSARDMMSNLANLGKVAESLRELEEKVKKDQSISNRQRGGGRQGHFEDPEALYED